MRHAHIKKTTQKNIAFGLFVGSAVASGRRNPGPAMEIVATGDDIRAVRGLLGETQTVFAGRFSRTARQLRTWERAGYRFTDRKPNIYLCRHTYAALWQLACLEACEAMRYGR